MRRTILLLAALLTSVGLSATATARDRFEVYDFQPISGPNPFAGEDCGLEVPPPLGPSTFRPKNTAFEPHAAVDPNNPDRAAAAWIQDFSVGFVVAYTTDGGRSWSRSVPPGLSDCSGGPEDSGSYDPHLSFGPDGRLYLNAMTGGVTVGRTSPSTAVNVLHSDDGGATWSQPAVVVPEAGQYNDFPTIVADPNQSRTARIMWSLHNGPFGGNTPKIQYSASTDGGVTWSVPRSVWTPPFAHFVDGSIVHTSDGTLVWVSSSLDSINSVTPAAQEPRVMEALHSTDGGVTWLGPVRIGAQSREQGVSDPETGAPIERGGVPTVTALPGGGVAAAWSEVSHDGRGRIEIATSRNGARWTGPMPAIVGPAPVFAPTLAASGDGRLAITYFDLRRDEPGDDELTTDLRFATSADRGRTWTKGARIATFDYRTAWLDPRSPDPVLNVGDFGGLAGLPHGFIAVSVLARPAARIGKSQAFSAVLLRMREVSSRIRVVPRRARNVVMHVRVRIAANREPAEGVVVRSGSARVVTGPDGRARLVRRRADDGEYAVRLGGRGYRPRRLTVYGPG